jgi:hypothetical protein
VGIKRTGKESTNRVEKDKWKARRTIGAKREKARGESDKKSDLRREHKENRERSVRMTHEALARRSIHY